MSPSRGGTGRVRLRLRQRIAAGRPRPSAKARETSATAGAADLDAGVAPGLEPAPRPAEPSQGLADAEAGHERDPAVHHDRLAMVARDPAQGLVEARGVEAAHLHSALAQPAPEPRARITEARPASRRSRATAHALGRRARDERVREAAADLVVVDDVALEVHAFPRLGRCGASQAG